MALLYEPMWLLRVLCMCTYHVPNGMIKSVLLEDKYLQMLITEFCAFIYFKKFLHDHANSCNNFIPFGTTDDGSLRLGG